MWSILIIVAALLLGTYLSQSPPPPAGDIVEYFGVTESLTNHAGIWLSQLDQSNLSKLLHPEYFSNPGYYIAGINGQRYPVHFIAYSLLLLPFRWMFELRVFSVVNTLLLIGTAAYLFHRFVHSSWKRLVLMITLFISPLLSFLWWPGPDIFSVCFLLLSLFWFYDDKPFVGSALAAVASWHSQPMMVVSLGMLAWGLYRRRNILPAFTILGLISIPYLYNYLIFGTLTPWTILQDNWTRLYGFGVQNVSLKKLFEQFFDLNMGLLWYAPVLIILGIYAWIRSTKEKKTLWLGVLFILAALAFQTNPAWHYGTAGYGPTRHVLFAIPFFIVWIVRFLKPKTTSIIALGMLTIIQLTTLTLNSFLTPSFEKTLYHSPYAQFVLDRFPRLYNPNPEIFVDRTNHTDLDHLETAIFGSPCKKAYVVNNDLAALIDRCGYAPERAIQLFRQNKLDNVYIDYE